MRPILLAGLHAALCVVWLSACTTTPEPVPPPPASDTQTVIVAQPVAVPPPAPVVIRPPAPIVEPPEEPVFETPSAFDDLIGWDTADLAPALASLRRSCTAWTKAEDGAALSPNLPEYGTFADWRPACAAARKTQDPRTFFETEFRPVDLTTATSGEGLLTGYYEPEIDVRTVPDGDYREPILARPKLAAAQAQPRRLVTPSSSRVIAYGRPIDVFFMQIQGSGRIKYLDGEKAGHSVRAAFDGHNSKPYTSIGAVLIRRGELKKGKASKAAIENWMERAGPEKTRELMNQNARYVYFTEQRIDPGEGPQGAMRVPLTAMGSLAVDPRYHPYGSLVWLNTTLPERAGDFRGQPTGLLLSAQDTGGAIKGPLRGDLFFGSGDEPGTRAGVMKHPARWTLLIPAAIAPDVRLN